MNARALGPRWPGPRRTYRSMPGPDRPTAGGHRPFAARGPVPSRPARHRPSSPISDVLFPELDGDRQPTDARTLRLGPSGSLPAAWRLHRSLRAECRRRRAQASIAARIAFLSPCQRPGITSGGLRWATGEMGEQLSRLGQVARVHVDVYDHVQWQRSFPKSIPTAPRLGLSPLG